MPSLIACSSPEPHFGETRATVAPSLKRPSTAGAKKAQLGRITATTVDSWIPDFASSAASNSAVRKSSSNVTEPPAKTILGSRASRRHRASQNLQRSNESPLGNVVLHQKRLPRSLGGRGLRPVPTYTNGNLVAAKTTLRAYAGNNPSAIEEVSEWMNRAETLRILLGRA